MFPRRVCFRATGCSSVRRYHATPRATPRLNISRQSVLQYRWTLNASHYLPIKYHFSSSAALGEANKQDDLSSTIRSTDPRNNSLLAPVHLREDPDGLLKPDHPAAKILVNSGLVIQRQLEMMNVLLGFEQANRYVILDAQGNHVGYMVEQEKGVRNILERQWLHTHRPFVTLVFDKHQNEVLRFFRPFSFINSTIFAFDPHSSTTGSNTPLVNLQLNTSGSPISNPQESAVRVSPLEHSHMRVLGAAQQIWAPLRRKYNLFLSHPRNNRSTRIQSTAPPDRTLIQFAKVDEPFLSWDFSVISPESKLLGSVNRNFAGFAREIFTDTGIYALRLDSAAQAAQAGSKERTLHARDKPSTGMTLDQRAVMLATAVTIDFDYFSRHSTGPSIMPFWFSDVGAASGGAAAGGIAEGATAGAVGAGTIAGYEAMQRGLSSQPKEDHDEEQPVVEQSESEEVWGASNHYPWDKGHEGFFWNDESDQNIGSETSDPSDDGLDDGLDDGDFF
ncbi:hypothetical protein FQN57_007258 [Myotisia sp. PD_48]|nr:hypothetical protein FQN57_007258 [Myotisia sp. PD_48]